MSVSLVALDLLPNECRFKPTKQTLRDSLEYAHLITIRLTDQVLVKINVQYINEIDEKLISASSTFAQVETSKTSVEKTPTKPSFFNNLKRNIDA